MENIRGTSDRCMLPLASLALSTCIALLFLNPLLTISQQHPHNFFPSIPIRAYLFLLNPLNFYLNTLSLLHHVTALAPPPETPSPLLFLRHLPRAAHTVSLATLIFTAPLSVHAAVAEESIGLAVVAAFIGLALVTVLSSFVKKLDLISRGFVVTSFSICISTGFLISFDKLSSSSYKNYYDPVLLLSLVSFFVFVLAITLLQLRMGAPAHARRTLTQAENLVIVALSTASVALLVGGYMMKVHFSVIGMEAKK